MTTLTEENEREATNSTYGAIRAALVARGATVGEQIGQVNDAFLTVRVMGVAERRYSRYWSGVTQVSVEGKVWRRKPAAMPVGEIADYMIERAADEVKRLAADAEMRRAREAVQADPRFAAAKATLHSARLGDGRWGSLNTTSDGRLRIELWNMTLDEVERVIAALNIEPEPEGNDA